MITRGLLILAMLSLVAGCEENPTAPSEGAHEAVSAWAVLGPFRQRIEVSPGQVMAGDTVTIISHLQNVSDSTATLWKKECSLGIETTLELGPVGGTCFAYSSLFDAPPGWENRFTERHVVGTGVAEGEYDLRVLHLVDPELWLGVRVVVK
jgi:hypothetical protein